MDHHPVPLLGDGADAHLRLEAAAPIAAGELIAPVFRVIIPGILVQLFRRIARLDLKVPQDSGLQFLFREEPPGEVVGGGVTGLEFLGGEGGLKQIVIPGPAVLGGEFSEIGPAIVMEQAGVPAAQDAVHLLGAIVQQGLPGQGSQGSLVQGRRQAAHRLPVRSVPADGQLDGLAALFHCPLLQNGEDLPVTVGMHRCDGENRPVPQPHSAGLVAAEILPVAVGIRPEVVGAHPEPLGGGLFQLLSGDQPAVSPFGGA